MALSQEDIDTLVAKQQQAWKQIGGTARYGWWELNELGRGSNVSNYTPTTYMAFNVDMAPAVRAVLMASSPYLDMPENLPSGGGYIDFLSRTLSKGIQSLNKAGQPLNISAPTKLKAGASADLAFYPRLGTSKGDINNIVKAAETAIQLRSILPQQDSPEAWQQYYQKVDQIQNSGGFQQYAESKGLSGAQAIAAFSDEIGRQEMANRQQAATPRDQGVLSRVQNQSARAQQQTNNLQQQLGFERPKAVSQMSPQEMVTPANPPQQQPPAVSASQLQTPTSTFQQRTNPNMPVYRAAQQNPLQQLRMPQGGFLSAAERGYADTGSALAQQQPDLTGSVVTRKMR